MKTIKAVAKTIKPKDILWGLALAGIMTGIVFAGWLLEILVG